MSQYRFQSICNSECFRMQIQLNVAIDFTDQNGDLHDYDGKNYNQYMRAIDSVVRILQNYDRYILFVIIPLLCHSDLMQQFVLTRYNRYRVSRIFKKNFFLKWLKMSQNMKKCKKKKFWYTDLVSAQFLVQKGHSHHRNQ